MVLEKGEKVHVMTRRLMESTPRAHVVGVVQEAADGLARIECWAYIWDRAGRRFVRKPHKRVRIVSLVSADNIVTVMPPTARLEDVEYRLEGRALTVTDGKGWSLDASEFASFEDLLGAD